jgi:malonyl-CoA/methylmalonyl-CoA synthetase
MVVMAPPFGQCLTWGKERLVGELGSAEMTEYEMDGGPGPDQSAGSLPGHLAEVLSSREPALWDDETGWLSYQALEEKSRQVARGLREAGLTTGDRLILSAASSSRFVACHLAALRLGLVLVPVNTAYKKRELEHIVTDCKPAAAITDDPARAKLIEELTEKSLVSFAHDDERFENPAGELPELDGARGEDPALIVYTSGTTGRPKGALLSQANLLANALAIKKAWHWTAEDRLVLPLPLFHVHGLCVGIDGALASGAAVVLRPGFDPGDVKEAIFSKKATMFFGVPTIYARLGADKALSKLRLCVSGSAPLPEELHRQIASGTGQVILERYGMSETLMIASNPYDKERRAGTVGQPFPGVVLRLDDLGEDGTGEVAVRGPSVFSGYFENPAATRACLQDGWFSTGDLGSIKEGYLSLVGRKSELIITGGYNVYPREVEDVLRSFPGVSDAAVLGLPDPAWGEQVVAFVEAEGPLDSDELAGHAASELASYKCPRRIEVVAELPRNALGKVVKAELAGR